MIDIKERFQSGASAYADYLLTIEGRLRQDLAWAHLCAMVEHVNDGCSRYALDVGGGTGAMAVRLALGGWRVAVADSSSQMLRLATEAANAKQVATRIEFHLTDAAKIAELFHPQSFDLVICHNVLEYVDDPAEIFRALRAVARPDGLLSVLVRNRGGEAMRAALKSHDLVAADQALEAESVRESLYGGWARLFDAQSLRALATATGLDVIAERGVRVVADYLPSALTESADVYARLLDFEVKIGARPDFVAIARYLQIMARVLERAD